MKKSFLFFLVVMVVVIVGFVMYKILYPKSQTVQDTTSITDTSATPTPLSPVFSYLPSWITNATWESPLPATEDTPYGSLTGMKAEGEVTGPSDNTGKFNPQDQPFMANLGFVEDIKFAADGPGASNWGYKKTENGKMQIVIFRYSSNRLLGPEDTGAPFLNYSVFVSDPFTPQT